MDLHLLVGHPHLSRTAIARDILGHVAPIQDALAGNVPISVRARNRVRRLHALHVEVFQRARKVCPVFARLSVQLVPVA